MAAFVDAALQHLPSLSVLQWVALAVGAAVLWAGCDPLARWRYWHIPGRKFGWPFIGTLSLHGAVRQHESFQADYRKYGPIFKIWFGPTPWVAVCEADAIRKLLYRCIDRFELPHTMLGAAKGVMDHNMLVLRSDIWKLIRKAWDPAVLHSSSLQGYAPLMQECGEQLLERLEGVQQRGEVVDICHELSKMTLDAVGTCAFGIRFQGSAKAAGAVAKEELEAGQGGGHRGNSEQQGSWEEVAPKLLAALQGFFRSLQLVHASRWVVGVVALPPFATLVRILAYILPDKNHRRTVQAHATMLQCSRRIIAASRLQRVREESGQQRQSASELKTPLLGTDRSTQATDCGSHLVSGAKKGRLAGPTGASGGVLPGSFVAQLEAWKAKHEHAEGVSDDLLAAQVISFLLAGYETTSNALGFMVHHLATHPEAQRKLQAELDAVLGGRKPTLDDLPKLEYLHACIKETLRRTPPTAILIRKTAPTEHNLTVLGKAIPPGTHLALFTYGVHNDPRYWARPEEFLPERFLPETKGKLGPFHENAYLPFGGGGRKCPGYKFAEQEMTLVGAALLQRFSFTRPQAEAGPLEMRTGISLTPAHGVRVRVHGRS